MEKVQVLLVGGRQAPNVIGVLLMQPKRVEFVVSEQEKGQLETLRAALRGVALIEGLDEIGEGEKVVDGTEFEDNLMACEEIVKKYKNREVQFNITCGSKIMALAALEVARRHGCRVFYIDTRKKRIIWLGGGPAQAHPFVLTIEQYLAAYGRKPQEKRIFEDLTFSQDQACEAARILATGGLGAVGFLGRVRGLRGPGPWEIAVSGRDEENVARRLADLRVIDFVADTGRIHVRSTHDLNFFRGTWLEVFVWSEAQKQVENGSPFFDEVKVAVEIPSGTARKELDVVCIHGGQLIHCSCKTGNEAFSTEHLDELSAISGLIGGRFCSRVFITNERFSDSSPKRREEFLEQATQREIVVVTGEELPNAGQILRDQALNPRFPRV
ncbi:MAG: Card1-like endonuclease domain-containing protein [Desulfotomaculales bacterium]